MRCSVEPDDVCFKPFNVNLEQASQGAAANNSCHTSHVTRHTSHVTRHTSHVTRHTFSNSRSLLLLIESSRAREQRGGGGDDDDDGGVDDDDVGDGDGDDDDDVGDDDDDDCGDVEGGGGGEEQVEVEELGEGAGDTPICPQSLVSRPLAGGGCASCRCWPVTGLGFRV